MPVGIAIPRSANAFQHNIVPFDVCSYTESLIRIVYTTLHVAARQLNERSHIFDGGATIPPSHTASEITCTKLLHARPNVLVHVGFGIYRMSCEKETCVYLYVVVCAFFKVNVRLRVCIYMYIHVYMYVFKS